MTGTTLGIKWELNLNTIVAIAGFLTTFAGLISLWNTVQFRQETMLNWIHGHEEAHTDLVKEIERFNELHLDSSNKMLDVTFREAQSEKAVQLLEERLSRISESYSNQFSDFRTQLNAIATQQALANQALQRLEAMQRDGSNSANKNSVSRPN